MQKTLKVQCWIENRTKFGLEKEVSMWRHLVKAFPRLRQPSKAIALDYGRPTLPHHDSHQMHKTQLPRPSRLFVPPFHPTVNDLVFLQRNKTVQRSGNQNHQIHLNQPHPYRNPN